MSKQSVEMVRCAVERAMDELYDVNFHRLATALKVALKDHPEAQNFIITIEPIKEEDNG